MKLKIVLLLILSFMLSGCTINYNLKINDDNSITENITFQEGLGVITDVDNQPVFDKLLNNYSSNYPNYIVHSNNIDVINNVTTATTTYSSIEKYTKKTALIDILSLNPAITINNNIVDLYINLPDNVLKYIDDLAYGYFSTDNLAVNINIPYRVVNSNAIKVNKNKYTWVITPDNKITDIHLSYIKNRRVDSFYFLGIIGIKYDIIVALGIILAIILIAVMLVFFVRRRGDKSNIV